MPTLSDDLWPADDPALAAFAEDLRTIAAGPAPEPRPGLVAAMGQGPVPLTRHAGRRKRMLAKTIVGGLAAKVAMGMGVAAASVTMAGAAGVLPEPAQDMVASVVAAATPFELPDPGVNLQVTGDPTSSTSTSTSISTSTTVAGDDDEGTDDTTGTTTAERKVNHGACVSTAAKNRSATEGSEPNSHGKTVSSVARSDCGKEQSTSTTSTTIGSSSTSSTSSTSTTVAASSSQRSGGSGSGNSGNGNGGNSGSNSGKGNSGKN